MDLVRLLPGAPSRNHHAAITITQLSASRHAAVTRAIGFLPRLLLGYVDQRIPAEGDAGGRPGCTPALLGRSVPAGCRRGLLGRPARRRRDLVGAGAARRRRGAGGELAWRVGITPRW